MTGLLMILFIGSLLQGANCNHFEVDLPQTVQVMTGSCVTVPCSFDIEKKYESNLNSECEAKWLLTSNMKSPLSDTNPATGDLTKKNCTTTFSNLQTSHTNNYYFRLDCNNDLKYSYTSRDVRIEVTDNFPSPTLTPSTLAVKEGDSVSLSCSAPAPCLPHPPTLTWTPSLGDTKEPLNQDKTLTKTSIMNFTASHLHDGHKISCTAVYKKNDGSSDSSLITSLMPKVLFPSRILFSSKCTKTSNFVNCSCETIGKPTAVTHWYLNEKLFTHSPELMVTNESLNSSLQRSIITINEPQERDLSNLLCFSSNSLGSASTMFYMSCFGISKENQDQISVPIFIGTVVVFLLTTCVLLFVVGLQKTYYKPKNVTTDTGPVSSGQHVIKELKKVSSNNSEEMNNSSGGKSADLVYATLTWSEKNKTKKDNNYVNMHPFGCSSLDERKYE